MRRRLVTVTLVATGACALGGLAGQSLHPTGVSAAAKKGAHAGTKAKSGATVRQAGTPTARAPHAGGTVTNVQGNTITVTPDAHKAGPNASTKVTTIIVNSSTTYAAGKGAAATLASITKGSHIAAEGTISSDGTTLTATKVFVGQAGGRGHGAGHGAAAGPHADGMVTGVSGNTISVTPDTDKAGSNEYSKVTTIVVGGSTTYAAGRGATANLASVTKGSFISAVGTVSSDGTTLTAMHVSVHAAKSKTG